MHYLEKQKFVILEQESQKIFDAIKSIAKADEDWKYNAACGNNYSGAWPDGTYQCITLSHLEKQVTSPAEVKTLHDRYFAFFEHYNSIKPKSEIEFIRENTFGKEFVVSFARKQYIEKKTEAKCRYEAYLGQSDPMLNSLSSEYDAKISGISGTLTMIFRCEETSARPLYAKIQNASGMIPDFRSYN